MTASNPSTSTILGLPWIPNATALCNYLNLDPQTVRQVIEHPERHYKRVRVRKRVKGYRYLHCPTPLVKAVQAWILRTILEKVPVDEAATAFQKGKGLLNNVEPHRNNHYFACFDLTAFFDSITFNRVYGVFRALRYSADAAEMLAKLCTVRGRLPQGGVTSPYLSNIVCTRLDRRIRKFTENRHVTYTRYADDITLSAKSPAALFSCVPLIRKIIVEEGFDLNESKTRVLFPQDCRRVTGLIISRRRVSVGRRELHRIRACIHKIHTNKLTQDATFELIKHVNGWMSHLSDVDPIGMRNLKKYSAILKAKLPVRRVAAATNARKQTRQP